MKKPLYRLSAVLLCCVLLCTAVMAAACSIRVTIEDETGTAVPDLSVELCQVTSFDGESHHLTEAFSQAGLSAEELAREGTAEQAETLYQYLLARELEGRILLTNAEGTADFAQLQQGVYLVFERGGQVLAFRPYLICLPAESEGELYYHIASAPKVIDPDSRSIMVMKLWDDDEDAAGLRPDHVQITLLRSGTAIRTVVLNEACSWQHTFSMLPGDGDYWVEETPVRHYAVTCEEVVEGFVLTNTYDPSDGPDVPQKPKPPKPPQEPEPPREPEPPETSEVPQEPSLPQTGFQMWPVYVLMLLGTTLVIWGLAEVCFAKEDT